MINPASIGRRIRELRKQKHISQERMALDLGFHQADISNIERGISSGVTDIVKLDMIAEYLAVPLMSLLTEEQQADEAIAKPANVKLKAYEPKQYRIVDVSFANMKDAAVSEIQLQSPSGKEQYVSFADMGHKVYFFQTKNSVFDELQDNTTNRLFVEKNVKYCFLSGDSYDEVFTKADERWVDICRYLIYVATEDEQDAKKLVQSTAGKRFCKIEVPKPDCEPSDLIDVDWEDLSSVYRYRLSLETDLKNPSIMSDGDADAREREKATLKKLEAACVPEEAYQTWKKDLLDAKVSSLMLTENLVTCFYQFAGFGGYKEILLESEVECFENWVNSCGSGFTGGHRPANKREIQTYAALHIADDLL